MFVLADDRGDPLLPFAAAARSKEARFHDRNRPLSWVELRGFEPLTPSMRTRCATRLRYSPENLSQRSKLCCLLAPRRLPDESGSVANRAEPVLRVLVVEVLVAPSGDGGRVLAR